MNNYQWLLEMDGEERQAWFDAEHVDPHSKMEPLLTEQSELLSDSLKKLEADVDNLLKNGFVTYAEIMALLDRQAMISERFMAKRYEETSSQLIKDKTDADLKAMALQEQVDELTAERDKYRDWCIRALEAGEKLTDIIDTYKAVMP